LNPQDVLGYLGKSTDEHLNERIAYLVEQKTKQKAINESNLGIRIEDREMAMLTPNETQQPAAQ
jgi:hypothetical protein